MRIKTGQSTNPVRTMALSEFWARKKPPEGGFFQQVNFGETMSRLENPV